MFTRHLTSAFALAAVMGTVAWGGESSRPTVVHGGATFQNNGPNWHIQTNSNKTIINWHSFGVPAGSTTQFSQPGKGSAVLNRVTGPLKSGIYGNLLSNGRVYLINPHGIVVGKSGVINTRGFVGSTLNASNSSFLAGKVRFSGDTTATVVNLGSIEATDGDVLLVAPHVENHGEISADKGKVALVAARDVLLTKNNEVFIQPSKEELGGTGVLNTGDIKAVRAELVAQGNIYALAINNEGVVNATGAVRENGRVVLRAEGGEIRNTGTLTANKIKKNGKTVGGEIQVLAEVVILEGDAHLDASGDVGGGEIYVGGNYQGKGPLPNAEQTFVGSDVVIHADALQVGDGGRVIVWANNTTWFHGELSARGGPEGGSGGFAEVSGGDVLVFRGDADLSAPKGMLGNLLLDPGSGSILDDGGVATDGDDADADPNSFAGDVSGVGVVDGDDATPTTIYESEIVGLTATANLIIAFDDGLTIDHNAGTGDGVLDLSGHANGTLTLDANFDNDAVGDLTFTDNNYIIRTGGRDLIFRGVNVSLGRIDTTPGTGGNVTVNATGVLTLNNNVTTDGGAVDFTGATAVSLGANVTIDTNTSAVAAGSVDFGAVAVNDTGSNFNLIVDATSGSGDAAVTMGAVGSTDPLGAVTISGSTIGLQAVTTAGAQNYTGSTSTNLGGTLTVDTAGAGVTVTGATNLNAGGGTITLTGSNAANDVTLGTVDGAQGLSITAGGGDVLLGIVGGGGAVSSTNINANTITLAAVTSSGGQSYTGTTNLGGTLTVNAPGAGVTVTGTTNLNAGGGTIALNGSNAANDVSLGVVNGTQTLSITANGGDVALGELGQGADLTGVTVSANTLTLNGDIQTETAAGAHVDFSGVTSIDLATDVNIDTEEAGGGDAGDVNFGTAAVNGAFALDIDATTSGANDGVVTLGQVGQGTALTTLSVDGDSINVNGNITTSGSQTYTPAVTLLGHTTFESTGAGAGDSITFSSTSNPTVGAGATNGTLDLGVVVNGGSMSFGGDVAANANRFRNITLTDASGTLTLTESFWAGGTVAITAPTIDLNQNGKAITAANVTLNATTGGVTQDANGVQLIVSNNLTLEGTGTFNLFDTDNQTVNLMTQGGHVSGTIDYRTDSNVTVNGVTTNGAGNDLEIDIGGGSTLGFLGVNSIGGSLVVTGGGGIDLGATLTVGTNIDFSSTVTLTADSTLNSGATGYVSLAGVVNDGAGGSPHSLTVNAGSNGITLTAELGEAAGVGNDRLDIVSLNTDGTVTDGNNKIHAAGLELVGDTNWDLVTDVVTLAADLTNAGAGTGTLAITNDGALDVGSVSGTNGITTDNQTVSLTTGGGGDITLNQALNAGTATVTLDSPAGANGAGLLTGGDLSLDGAGTFNLNTSIDTVTDIGLTDGTSSVQITNNKALATGSAITAQAAGGISLTTTGGSNLTLDHALDAGGNTIALDWGNGTLTQNVVGLTANTLTLAGAAGAGLNFNTGNATNVETSGAGITGASAVNLTTGATTINNVFDVNGNSLAIDHGANTLGLSATITADGGFTETGTTGGVNVTGATIINTSGGPSNIDFLRPITLNGNLTLNAGLTGGVIAPTNTLSVSDPGNDNTLAVQANDFGDIDLTNMLDTFDLDTGNVAAITLSGNYNASNLFFTTGGDLTVTGALSGGTLDLDAGAGATLELQNDATATTQLDLGGGTVTVSAGTASAPTINLIGANNVNVTGGAVNATGGAATLNITTGAFSQTNGSISAGTLNLTANSASQTGGSLDAGTLILESTAVGDFSIDFGGAATTNTIAALQTTGSNVDGDVSIASDANNVTLGNFNTDDNGGGNLTLDLRAGNGGAGGNLDITGTVDIEGSFSQLGGGAVSITGGSLTVSAGNNIAFAGALTISGSATLNTSGAGGIDLSGGVIGPGGDDSLTLNAGTAGVNFGGDVGSAAAPLVNLTIDSAGGATQAGGTTIHAGTLQLLNTGPYTLNTSVDNLNTNGTTVTGNISVTNDKALVIGGTALAASGNVSIATTSGGITLDQNVTSAGAGGIVTLNSASGVSGAGTIAADNLLLQGAGTFDLNTTVDTIATGALGGGSTVIVAETDSLVVGSVGGFNGITAPGGITLSNAAGTMTLDQPLDAGGGTINLNWIGSVTQNAGSTFTAGLLNLEGNNAGTTTLNVTGVNNIATPTGISGAGNIVLTSTGTLGFNDFNATTNTLKIDAAGVTSAGGTIITAEALQVVSSGAVSVNASVNTVAASVTGGNSFQMLNSKALTIAQITTNTTTTGITATGVTVNTAAGALTIDQAVDANGGGLMMNAPGGATQGASGQITDTGTVTISGGAGADFVLNHASNAFAGLTSNNNAVGNLDVVSTQSVAVGNLNATGNQVLLNTAGSSAVGTVTADTLRVTGTGTFGLNTSVGTIAANVSGPLTISEGGALTVGSVAGTNGLTTGNQTLSVTAGGMLTVSQAISAGSADAILQATGINQTGGTLTASGLAVSGTGGFNLAQANNVSTLAVDVNGVFNYQDQDAFTIGTVGGVTGVSTGGNDLALVAGGQVTMGQSVNAGAGTAVFQSSGLSQTGGTLTANAVGMTGTGTYDLAQNNNVSALAAAVNGNLTFTNQGELTVGTVGGTDGINTGGNDLVLTAGGVNQTAGAAISANGLALAGTGTFDLSETNSVNTLAANVNGALSYTDQNALTVATVAGTSGIDTGGNDLTITTGDQLDVDAALDAGTNGLVTLDTAAGGVVQAAGGTITTGGLLLRGTGQFALDNPGNLLDSIATNTTGGAFTLHTVGLLLNVATLDGVAGITAGGDVTLIVPTDKAVVNIDAAIAAFDGNVLVQADKGTINVNAGVAADPDGTGQGTASWQGKVNFAQDPKSLLTGAGETRLIAGKGGGNEGGSITTNETVVTTGGAASVESDDLGETDISLGGFNLGSLGAGEWELKWPKELIAARETLEEIFKRGFDDQFLHFTASEIKRAMEAVERADEVLQGASPVYHSLPEGSQIKGTMLKMMIELKKARRDVRRSSRLLETFLKRLYLEEKRDRINQDAFKGAIQGLREANERIKVATPVLKASADVVRGAGAGATKDDALKQMKAAVRDAALAARQELKAARERLDRIYTDVLIFDFEE